MSFIIDPYIFGSSSAPFSQSNVTSTATGPNGIHWTVPADTTIVWAKLWGSGGGSGAANGTANSGNGGGGAYIEAKIPVTPGETLTLVLGPGGDGGTYVKSSNSCFGGLSGYGPTMIVRQTSPTTNQYLLIAATGAGGGGSSRIGDGGDGAAGNVHVSIGNPGQNGFSSGHGTRGTGANGISLTGGIAGNTGQGGGNNGNDGTIVNITVTNGGGLGGDPSSTGRGGGGGGGGGYYGGGGAGGGGVSGSGGGGGGGISFSDANNTETIAFAGSGVEAGNNTDSDYIAGTGNGGIKIITNNTSSNGVTGGIGLIVLRY